LFIKIIMMFPDNLIGFLNNRKEESAMIGLRRGVPELGRGSGAGLCASVLVGVLAGCSGGDGRVPVYPVAGKVTVGGEVPEGALIVFYPAEEAGQPEHRPSAKVEPDGRFKLTTYDAGDGAPAGDYTAVIQWNKIVKRGNDYVAGPNVVPPPYASRERSKWKVHVASAPNDLPPLDITR
jgi:hypothetical protein